MTEYRIEYSIQRCSDDSEEFVEIGFGSSATWSDLDGCTHAIGSCVSNGQWETETGMPDPEDVMRAIRGETSP